MAAATMAKKRVIPPEKARAAYDQALALWKRFAEIKPKPDHGLGLWDPSRSPKEWSFTVTYPLLRHEAETVLGLPPTESP